MKGEIGRIDLGGVNCYLVDVGDGYILFDTGGHITMDKQFSNRRDILVKELEKAGCRPGNLKLVVLTHGDSDHTANAAYLREKYGARLAMHKDDLELVEKAELEYVMKTFQYRSTILKLVFLLLKPMIRKVTIRVLEDFERFTPDLLLEEGADLSEYGFDARVLHIPGHTPGSIGILAENGSLISGDTFINTGRHSSAPNAYDFRKLEASVARLAEMNLKRVFPGHGEPYAV